MAHENGAAIRCLQEAQEAPTFGSTCRAEVQAYEIRISADFRRGPRALYPKVWFEMSGCKPGRAAFSPRAGATV